MEHHEYFEWWLRRISRQPGLANQQRVLAKNTFSKFDADQSGAIDCSEFSDLVASLGVEFSPKECEQAIQELDTDQSGLIEVEEFVNWWVNRTQGVRKGGGLIAFKLKKLANKAAQMFYTDIHKATWDGDVNLVKLFLDAPGGGHINAPDTTEYGNGWTPLHYASYRGHTEIVSELLLKGARVDTRNDDGFTPLFYAAQQNFPGICTDLLNAGADPSICGLACNPRNIQSEADAIEDMYYGIPPLCPADFVSSDIVQSNDGLREVFSAHEKFNIPLQPEIGNVMISKVGKLSFDVLDMQELSHLPIRKWKITFYMNDEFCTEYTAEHGVDNDVSVSHSPPQDNLLAILTGAHEGNIMSIEAIAINACGEGERSYKTDVNMTQIF